MKLESAVLLLLAGPVGAGETRAVGGAQAPVAVPVLALPPGPPALHPALVGGLSEAASPLRARLDAAAEGLVGLGAGGAIAAGAAGAYLEALRGPKIHPVDRVAAGVISRLIVEPGLMKETAERHPNLPASILRLENFVEPAGGYRGSLNDNSTLLGRLASAMSQDAAVSAAFDSAPGRAPSLDLEGLAYRRGRLRYEGRKAERLSVASYPKVDLHLRMPGATVQAYGDPTAGAARGFHPRAAHADAQATSALAEIGAGPRHLGLGAVKAGDKEAFSVGVKERIYGESLWDLVERGRLGDEEYWLVQALYERLAAAGIEPRLLEKHNIIVGRTAADPARRAFVIEPGEVERSSLPPDQVRAKLAARETFDRMEVITAGDAAAIPDPKYRPMEEILRDGWAWSTRSTWWKSLKGAVGRLWK